MITDFRDRLRLRLDEKRARITESLADGGAKDYADYRERVGRSKGLLEARETIDEVLKELRTDDD